MDITCKLCKKNFISDIVGISDQDNFNQLLMRLNKHFQLRHQSHLIDFQQKSQMVAITMGGFILMKEMIDIESRIPDESKEGEGGVEEGEEIDDFVLDKYLESQELLAKELDLFEDDEEEDEEEVNDNDKKKSNLIITSDGNYDGGVFIPKPKIVVPYSKEIDTKMNIE